MRPGEYSAAGAEPSQRSKSKPSGGFWGWNDLWEYSWICQPGASGGCGGHPGSGLPGRPGAPGVLRPREGKGKKKGKGERYKACVEYPCSSRADQGGWAPGVHERNCIGLNPTASRTGEQRTGNWEWAIRSLPSFFVLRSLFPVHQLEGADPQVKAHAPTPLAPQFRTCIRAPGCGEDGKCLECLSQ